MSLRVRLDVNAEMLGGMTITNDGTGTEEIGHYDVAWINADTRQITRARVEDWPRARPVGLLVAAAFVAINEAQDRGRAGV